MTPWTPPPAPGPDAPSEDIRRYERAVRAGQNEYRRALGPWWKDYLRWMMVIVGGLLGILLFFVFSMIFNSESGPRDLQAPLGQELQSRHLAITASNLRNPDDTTGEVCVDIKARNVSDRKWGAPRRASIISDGVEMVAASRVTHSQRLLPDGTTSGKHCFDTPALRPGDYRLQIEEVGSVLRWDFTVE